MGLTLPGRIGILGSRRSRNRWIIVLDDAEHSSKDFDATIAHEIAHAWLGHDRIGEIPEDCEPQAAALAREWGFLGRASDLDYNADR